MEKQEAKSKWDELARALGADVPPESPEPVAAIETSPEPQLLGDVGEPSQSRAKPRPTPPKRSPVNWDALNNELGLEPPPAAPPDVETKPIEPMRPVGREAPPERRRTEARPRREQDSQVPQARGSRERKSGREGRPARGSRRDDSRERRPRHDDEYDSGESKRPRPRRDEERKDGGRQKESRAESSSRRGDQRESGRPHDFAIGDEPRDIDDREVRDEVEAGRRAADVAETVDEIIPAEPPKSASVSLWHKIFGLPAEQSAKLSGSAPEGGEIETLAEAREPREGAWDDEFEPSPPRERFEESDDAEGIGALQNADAPSEDDRKRRRPRRRRRGRKPDEERGAAREAPRARRAAPRSTEDVDESFDFDDEFGGAPAGHGEFAASPAFGESDDDLPEVESDDRGKPMSGRAAGHRSIPSWEDAIGAIVDHNLQSRSQRKQAAHPSGRGGPTHGRPRGGRRRKKP